MCDWAVLEILFEDCERQIRLHGVGIRRNRFKKKGSHHLLNSLFSTNSSSLLPDLIKILPHYSNLILSISEAK